MNNNLSFQEVHNKFEKTRLILETFSCSIVVFDLQLTNMCKEHMTTCIVYALCK